MLSDLLWRRSKENPARALRMKAKEGGEVVQLCDFRVQADLAGRDYIPLYEFLSWAGCRVTEVNLLSPTWPEFPCPSYNMHLFLH